MTSNKPEVVPAILRKSYEDIEKEWKLVQEDALHIQVDVTDGIFAGDGSFRDLRRFKQLPESEKLELHLMVHLPAAYADDVIDVNPARCIFHLEAFSGADDLRLTYETLREKTSSELGLAINPDTPNQRLEEYLSLIDYVLFMGVHPGWAGQALKPIVFQKIGAFCAKHPHLPVAVDGHVNKETMTTFIKAGADILCLNSPIFRQGNARENLLQLKLLAEANQRD